MHIWNLEIHVFLLHKRVVLQISYSVPMVIHNSDIRANSNCGQPQKRDCPDKRGSSVYTFIYIQSKPVYSYRGSD